LAIMRQAAQALKIAKIPILECPLRYTPDYVEITYCLSKCWKPCNEFLDFTYLTDDSYKEDVLFLIDLYNKLQGVSFKNKLKRFKAYTNYRNSRVK
jgi:hypothetical protein